MNEESKKISFGFSKLSKKPPILVKNKVKEEDNVQLIDCVEGKSIKIRNEEKKEEKVLVIPLTRNQISQSNGNVAKMSNDLSKINVTENESAIDTSTTNVVETLDSLAAREILEEVNKTGIEEKPKIFAVPLTTNVPVGEKESTLDDYENIPVSDFGLAMLRGMGWSPGKGIGKIEKLVTSSVPTLRPKGMGLGADKVIKTAPSPSADNANEELKLVKGGFVRIIAGQHKDSYGQIEGFDEESGRLFVKLSLKNTVVSFNEFMVQVVNKNDFTKNSKVINVGKYEQYKDKEIDSNNSDERINKSHILKNAPSSNTPSLEKSSKSSYIKNDDNHKRHSSKHKSYKKHDKIPHRNRNSSDDSPPTRTKSHRSTFDTHPRRSRSSSDSSPRQRPIRSRSREHISSSRSKNYNSNQDRKRRSRSRSPRRRY